MKKIIILIVALIIVCIIYAVLPKSTASVRLNSIAPSEIESRDRTYNPGSDTNTSAPSSSTNTGTNTIYQVSSGGAYEAYSPDKLAAATDGKVILFFHAPWCPTCRTADADIVKNSASIPAEITILKTDYDSMTNLKKKYGVTYQHTFVQVDAQGNMITKWSGSPTLADIVLQVNKVIRDQ